MLLGNCVVKALSSTQRLLGPTDTSCRSFGTNGGAGSRVHIRGQQLAPSKSGQQFLPLNRCVRWSDVRMASNFLGAKEISTDKNDMKEVDVTHIERVMFE